MPAATQLKCDYLVVGAGAASIAFIDTLLTELPSAKIVLVDKKQAPGGQWVDAYGFVRLHQPSLLYGVSSRQLEGNWLKLMLGNLTLPWNHRASKKEILTHFHEFVDAKVAKGQVIYYHSCGYDLQQEIVDDVHSFSTLDGNEIYSVKVEAKLVNGILGECKIPSQCPVQFPVDEGINLLTPNELFDDHVAKKPENKNYFVLGAGKTGMDAVVYLQRVMKVKPDNITWVISNDVWMLAREGGGNPWSWPQALLKHEGDREKACAALEERGVFVRLDKEVKPTKFRFPVVGRDELELMHKIKNVVRRGRVTCIRLDKERVTIGFGSDQEPWVASSTADDTTFIHCTSPGPFNGEEKDEVFVSDKEMNLSLLFAPPVSISMSCLGLLESARRKGTLDLDFGKQLLLAAECSLAEGPRSTTPENEVLRSLIRAMRAMTLLEGDVPSQFKPILNLALFICLVDPDPSVGYNWLKGNRLSFLSIPGFKCKVYENMSMLLSKGKTFGFSEGELCMFSLLRDKLKPLEGK